MFMRIALNKRFVPICAVAALLAPLTAAKAQVEDRPSVVGARLARPYLFNTEDYNVKAGPVTFKATAELRTDYNDNISLTEHHPDGDVIVTPALDLQMFWPVTPFNALRLNAQFGYSWYLNHSELNTAATAFSIAPDSVLDYDIYVSNFTINLHDRFALIQDPVNQPTLSNVPFYGHFVNTAGVSVFWFLNKNVIVTGSYDHTDDIPTSSEFDFAQYDEDQFSASIRCAVAPHVAAGLEGSVADARYRTGDKPDGVPVSAGPFIDWNITPYTRLRVAAGYQGIFFDGDTARSIAFLPGTSPSSGPTVVHGGTAHVSDESSPYFNIELSNRLSRHFQQTLSAGHELSLDITAASASLYYIRYNAEWEISSRFTLHGLLFYDNGHQNGADLPEDFDRIGCGLSTSVNLSRKLTASLGYQFIHKNSDIEGNSYYQNFVSLSLRYSF